ncbi:S26 family signal peptidase [Brevundimonas sp. WCHBH090558]|uniref:S26 family signal peptidase n=1 Tax=Brevundimonas TaxID=41275 RepID=UPI0016267F1A|nr:S26 family signal peptidase [Brevundimonas huaxiensis]MBC1181856.1 S26 family signal peptidase [Brevundimonas huaxiensis]
MSPLDNGNRWCVTGVAVFALGCLALVAQHVPALALVNESPSLPEGLYARRFGAEIERGVVVAIPQPAAARAYLGDLGMPGDVALIKRVAAAGGDRVCVEGAQVLTPDGVWTVRSRDRGGAILPRWSGCRRLAPDELFLLGDTAGSFDSRYFGPVARSEVLGVYQEVLRW